MSELLVVRGPDIRLARSKVALVLAICAAARGRSVFAAESADGGEQGYAMAVPRSMLGDDGVLTFPGAPAKQLTVAVKHSGDKFSGEFFSEGAAAKADLLVLSCDEEAQLPDKPMAEVLVTAYEGELLRRSAAMRTVHSSAALVATFSFPRGRNHQHIVSRATEIFPEIAGHVHDLPLYLFKTLRFPSAADLTGELWQSAAGILDAVLKPQILASSSSASELGGQVAGEEAASAKERPSEAESAGMAGAASDGPAAVAGREKQAAGEEAASAKERSSEAESAGMAGAASDGPAAVAGREKQAAGENGASANLPAENYQQPADLGQMEVVVGERDESLPDKEISVGIRIARSSTPRIIETQQMQRSSRGKEQDNIEQAKKRREQSLCDNEQAGEQSFSTAKLKNKHYDTVGYLPGKPSENGVVPDSEHVKDSIGRTREAFGKLVK